MSATQSILGGPDLVGGTSIDDISDGSCSLDALVRNPYCLSGEAMPLRPKCPGVLTEGRVSRCWSR